MPLDSDRKRLRRQYVAFWLVAVVVISLMVFLQNRTAPIVGFLIGVPVIVILSLIGIRFRRRIRRT
jgi:hypothetical protein